MRLFWMSTAVGLLIAVLLGQSPAQGEWQTHPIRQGDGRGGWEPVQSVPKVGIQIGPQACDLERYAAEELAGYLDKLFHVRTKPTAERPEAADCVLLVGTPETNPAMAEALGTQGWPKVSDQGVVLKRTVAEGKPALAIGGGSPAATLWAVYELVERWGVRYLLHGDVLPEPPGAFRLPETDVVLEPSLRVRQWRTINDFACGPESWGLDEHRRVIDQLAKLRFNRIFVSVWAYQPFLDLKVKGIERKSASLWYDFHYPITDDMPGRHIFGKEPEFWNPDLPRAPVTRNSLRQASGWSRGSWPTPSAAACSARWTPSSPSSRPNLRRCCRTPTR